MRIEKLSENQIRCTLNKADLASRQLKISELAYGSEKAKDLFRDMMQQASYEFGFDAEDIPLMIEAIPVSPDCIILIITKVEDPEELDTRFSKFSPHSSEEDGIDEDYEEDGGDSFGSAYAKEGTGSADEILNLFNKVKDYLNKNLSEARKQAEAKEADTFVPFHQSLKGAAKEPSDHNNVMEQALLENLDHMETIEGTPASAAQNPNVSTAGQFEINMIKVYSFVGMKAVSKAAYAIGDMYAGINNLYKDEVSQRYYLQISKSQCDPVIYNKVCNILSEYGSKENNNYARSAFFEEHYTLVIKDRAVQILAAI